MEKQLTGYPSIDKPWLKYYSEEDQKYTIPEIKIVENMYQYIRNLHGETALEFMKTTVSYDKLRERIEETARALRELGVKPGETVSVCLPNQPEAVYLFYAINKVGAVSNMLDPRSNKAEFRRLIVESHSNWLFSMDTAVANFADVLRDSGLTGIVSISVLQSLPLLIQRLALLKDKTLGADLSAVDYCKLLKWKAFIKLGKGKAPVATAKYVKDAPAVICYTGGSTGVPKGAVMTDRNFNAYIAGVMKNEFNTSIGDLGMVIAPPWVMYGISNSVNAYLCMGQRLLLLPMTDAVMFAKQILQYKPNHIVGVPTALRSLINDPDAVKADFSYIKTFILGAEKLTADFENEANIWLSKHGCKVKLCKGYGMTELGAAVCYTKGECNKPGSVGIPYVTDIVSVFKDTENGFVEGKINEQGELCVQSPKCMQSYFASGAVNNEMVIKTHPDGSVWVHTGDIGHVDEDGCVFVDGRIKNMLIRGGYKVFPAAVEIAIAKSADIKECAVAAAHDPMVGEILKAYLVVREGVDRETIIDSIKRLCADELYSYEVPDMFEVLDALPVNNVGKVDYRALEERAKAHE